jgi:hypothetical protein
MREVCEKLAIPSADQLEEILKGSRTPGRRSKTEPFKLTDFVEETSQGARYCGFVVIPGKTLCTNL